MNSYVMLLIGALVSADPASAERLTSESAQLTLIEEVKIPAQEAGVLASLRVREGDRVTRGQELGSIESDRAELAQARALIELRIAKEKSTDDVEVRLASKASELAQMELKRSRDSSERFPRSVTASELDRLRLAEERAELEVEKARRDLKLAGLDHELQTKHLETAALEIRRRKLIAPIDGTVVFIYCRAGEWVGPGETVIRIISVDRLRVEAFIKAEVPRGSLEGRPATLTLKHATRSSAPFAGRVTFVDPEIEPVSGQFRVWAEFENRAGLLSPGMHGELSIELPKSASTAAK